MSVRLGVVGIVYRKEENRVKFLVLKRTLLWKGWEFPKGGIERGDITEENALRREIKDETGLEKIRIMDKLDYTIRFPYPKKYAKQYKHTETVQSVYLVRALEDSVKTSKEHKGYRWLSYAAARRRLTHANHRKALDAAWKQLKKQNSVKIDFAVEMNPSLQYITS